MRKLKLPPISENIPQCTLTIMNAGFCKTKKSHLLKGADNAEILVPALFFLIEHPIHGKILFDTGYSTHYFEAVKHFPFSLMNKITPVKISEEENAVNQLVQRNISADEIQIILLSHLHADHAGGIKDFKNSTVFVEQNEWEYGQKSNFGLLLNGYLKSLYSSVNKESLKLLNFEKNTDTYGPLDNTIDLFNDETIVLVPLPGHSIGQFGLLLNISEHQQFLLIADSAFIKNNYRKNTSGSFLSQRAHYDKKEYEKRLPILNKIEQDNPYLEIIPSHDPLMYQKYVKDSIN